MYTVAIAGAAIVVAAVLLYVWNKGRTKLAEGRNITFEFGETEASNAFWDRNQKAFPAFMRLLDLTNKAFGREYRIRSRVEDICFHLGETCRTDFLEILFLAVNGYGIGAQKLLRGLFERALALEYIRQNPALAEKFVRFAAIQEYKASKAAVGFVGIEQFDAAMPPENKFEEQEKRYQAIKGEFEQTDCKKCKTKKVGISWDVDVKTMVGRVGQPFEMLYFTCYVLANLHVHATLASAFQRESTPQTPEQRNIDEAEFSVVNAILTFITVIQSQDSLFNLGLQADIDACRKDVDDVWKDRPHGARARKAAAQA
jgi:Family of unknown function (DUF5677)